MIKLTTQEQVFLTRGIFYFLEMWPAEEALTFFCLENYENFTFFLIIY